MLDMIKQAKPEEMDGILRTVRSRYRELYPQWELITISLEKNTDRDQQLDNMIAFLQNMKQK